MSLLRSIQLRIVGSKPPLSTFNVRHYFFRKQAHRVHRLIHLDARKLHPANKIVHSDLALVTLYLAHAMVGAADDEALAMALEGDRRRILDQLAVIVAQRPHARPLAVHSAVDIHHTVPRLGFGPGGSRSAIHFADNRDARRMLAEA